MALYISVTLEGVTPLLCNAFTDSAQLNATNGQGTVARDKNATPREIAEAKLYRDPEGAVVIPQPNILRCFIDAGKYFQYSGKSKITTIKSSIIPAVLEVDGVYIPLLHKDPWTVDSRPVRIPATGGRILAHRPCFNDWRLELDMKLDTTGLDEGTMRSVIDKAGSAIGLGDFRPDCKGPFGKFKVVKWERSL